MTETFVNVIGGADAGPYRCPCCGYVTLSEPDRVRGGPNRGLSLTAARRNFARLGASDERRRQFVRAPGPEEYPDGV